jgi:sulfate adenylyltransferase subunit 2
LEDRSFLDGLEARSIFTLREVRARLTNPAVLWSMGKDSTTLLHLCRKAFFGRVPFPVLHLDTGHKFPEMYAFRDRLAREWDLDLRVVRNQQALDAGVGPARGALECCTRLKTGALKQALEQHRFDGLLLAIRWDEHGVRAKERVFSPRDAESAWDYDHQPCELWARFPTTPATPGGHVRVHPLLHWREVDVWEYVLREGLPVNPLYFARDGRRFRSLGCEPCTVPIQSQAADVAAIVDELKRVRTAERAGRLLDKERAFIMQKLRAMGYM